MDCHRVHSALKNTEPVEAVFSRKRVGLVSSVFAASMTILRETCLLHLPRVALLYPQLCKEHFTSDSRCHQVAQQGISWW